MPGLRIICRGGLHVLLLVGLGLFVSNSHFMLVQLGNNILKRHTRKLIYCCGDQYTLLPYYIGMSGFGLVESKLPYYIGMSGFGLVESKLPYYIGMSGFGLVESKHDI